MKLSLKDILSKKKNIFRYNQIYHSFIWKIKYVIYLKYIFYNIFNTMFNFFLFLFSTAKNVCLKMFLQFCWTRCFLTIISCPMRHGDNRIFFLSSLNLIFLFPYPLILANRPPPPGLTEFNVSFFLSFLLFFSLFSHFLLQQQH